MTRLPDQRGLWDQWHSAKGASGHDQVHEELRALFLDALGQRARRGRRRPAVLDLGCGQGHDVAAFARAGYQVSGIDLSPVAVRRARRGVPLHRRHRVRVQAHDLAATLPYPDAAFAGAYSHLALHYFDDETTKALFGEIFRVLQPGGLLVFSVKSTADPYFRQGDRLGERIYSRHGHTRHFFDEGHLRELLETWEIQELQACRGHYASREESAFIRVAATRPEG